MASDGIVPNRGISWLMVQGLGSNPTPNTNTWQVLSRVPPKSQPTTVIVAYSTRFVDGEIAIYLVVPLRSTAAQTAETQFPNKTQIKLPMNQY